MEGQILPGVAKNCLRIGRTQTWPTSKWQFIRVKVEAPFGDKVFFNLAC